MENSKELLLIADAVSKEKGLEPVDVLLALAEGMETAIRRDFPEGASIRVNIDPDTGNVEAFRVFKIVSQIENVEAEMLENEIEDEIVEDGYVLEPHTFTLNRQQFNITKQVALQRIKNESREQQILGLLDRSSLLLTGTVKVVRKDQIIVDTNGLDITLFRRNLLPKDNFKSGDKVTFVLEKENNHYNGTRISDEYLIEVFRREVVQIEEEEIEIVAVARAPGFRSKVILKSNRPNLDPVKTVIGVKGVHIKSINFTLGENVDLIPYDSNIAQLLIQSMLPVNVTNILIDEDLNSLDISVSDDEIAQAIGKSGKNIELVSKLLGWTVNVFSDTQWAEKNNSEDIKNIAILKAGLNCDDELAQLILDIGVTSLEEVAYLPIEEFYIEELDEETTNSLRENAKETLASKELTKKALGVGDLVVLGFNEEQIEALQTNQVINNFDISELSTYDLNDILPTLDTEVAMSIIVASRKIEDAKDGANS